MRAVLEVILSLLAVFGLLNLGWLLFGRILTPAGGRCCAVIPGLGDGEDLEQAALSLLWLRGMGLLTGPILVADCGLSDAGLAVAEALKRREPAVQMCRPEELEDYLIKREAEGREGAEERPDR